MKLLNKGLFGVLVAICLCFGCTKPTENIKIVLDTDVIKYTALIHVTDASNPGFAPPSLTLSLSGQNASEIYEISGKKIFTITDGIIAIGPGPALTPTTDNPVKVDVNLSAPGYVPIVKSVQFVPGQLQQVVDVVMESKELPAVNTLALAEAGSKIAVTLNFIGLCANKSDFELRPSVYLFYHETGSKAGYAYLGFMDKGKITANLVQGKTYDFKLTYAGVNYIVTQKIDQAEFTEHVTLGDICSTF